MIEAIVRNSFWVVNGLVFAYFILLNGVYFITSLVAFRALRRYTARLKSVDLEDLLSAAGAPPITLIVPAYNEEATCVEVVRALLTLDYPEYEVIVVNDGSTDSTPSRLTSAFEMVPAARMQIADFDTAPVSGVLRSRWHPNLWLINKANGGKPDALNSGLAFCQTPLFCVMDADTILERDALLRIARPFLEEQRTVAAGGVVRVVNGCTIESGSVVDIRMPKNWLARLQVLEYLRAFLAGRMGWHALDATLIISGAFGVFRRSVAVAAGGFRTDVVGEDVELVVRLHRHCRERGMPYKISFVPDPVAWTQVPETLAGLGRQRDRWQRGLSEALTNDPSKDDLQSLVWPYRARRDATLLHPRDAGASHRGSRLYGVRDYGPHGLGQRGVRRGLPDGGSRAWSHAVGGGSRAGGDHLPTLPPLLGSSTAVRSRGRGEPRVSPARHLLAGEGDGFLRAGKEGLGADGEEGILDRPRERRQLITAAVRVRG